MDIAAGGNAPHVESTQLRSHRLWLVGLFAHLTAVTAIGTAAYLSLLPNLAPYLTRHYDLALHAVLIGLLAFFLDGALSCRPVLHARLGWLRLGPAIVLALAGLEELAQSLSPVRSCSLSDFVADLVGVVVFSHLALRAHRASVAREERRPTSSRHESTDGNDDRSLQNSGLGNRRSRSKGGSRWSGRPSSRNSPTQS